MGVSPLSSRHDSYASIPDPYAYSPRGSGSYAGNGAPPIPAKVPVGDGFAGEDLDALSLEMQRIGLDLGSSGGAKGVGAGGRRGAGGGGGRDRRSVW